VAYRVIRSARPEEPLLDRLLGLAEAAETRGEPFLLGLSGGSTPRQLYRMMAEPFSRLSRTHLIQIDERLVAEESDDSNQKMLSGTLARPAGIPAERLLFVDVNRPAAEYARRLERLLEATGKGGLDTALLGLGEDGHTASVFPEDERFDRPETAYRSSSPAHSHPRITLSLPFLARSGLLCVLVKGENKRAALEGVLGGKASLPAAHLPPENTEIYTNLA
jgi:6-phosphogluconolactonase